MEFIGVPWFIAVRHLAPPLFLLVVGGALMVWRPPRRRGLVWAALVLNLVAAALPYGWIGLQILTDQAERTVFGLVMTLLQPGVVVVGWLLLLAAVLAQRPEGRAGTTAPARAGTDTSGERSGSGAGAEPERSRSGAGAEPERSRSGAGAEPERSRSRSGAGAGAERERGRERERRR
ncbi:hypothetical protein [Nocardiopsis sp. NRRL B-16309]|uniref:hypothetical protein n=1 Tax=Nocardiopsis sp. NRRL B-16309 TaxID=1519494 RepID=UPI000A6E06AF